mmetsp:Transcript_26063/g.42602  ORF Transcript_26063/g.42602 Transcript_26063/m.42602 type:complete len:226 (+) Transcript_26063:28-705(+)
MPRFFQLKHGRENAKCEKENKKSDRKILVAEKLEKMNARNPHHGYVAPAVIAADIIVGILATVIDDNVAPEVIEEKSPSVVNADDDCKILIEESPSSPTPTPSISIQTDETETMNVLSSLRFRSADAHTNYPFTEELVIDTTKPSVDPESILSPETTGQVARVRLPQQQLHGPRRAKSRKQKQSQIAPIFESPPIAPIGTQPICRSPPLTKYRSRTRKIFIKSKH